MDSDALYENQELSAWRRILKDRTFGTIVLALLLIVGMGLMRPDKPWECIRKNIGPRK